MLSTRKIHLLQLAILKHNGQQALVAIRLFWKDSSSFLIHLLASLGNGPDACRNEETLDVSTSDIWLHLRWYGYPGP